MGLSDVAKSALSVSWVFGLYQSLVGAPACHRRFIESFVRPKAGDRVIDLGCGIGASLEHLPQSISYVGVDLSPQYIEAARARYPGRGTFVCSDVATVDLSDAGPFDLAISFGVLHHLDDVAAEAMVGLAHRVVRPGGQLVTIDPCRVENQAPIARLLIDHDRGRYIRDAERYRRLFEPWGRVETEVVSDMLRIPYSMIVARLAIA
jgi:SAM-dependent methyltransferase